jgi:hypothetical protein
MNSEIQQTLVGLGVTVITTFAGWLWAKVRGEKKRDLRELLDEEITEEVIDALDSNTTAATIETRLREAAQSLGKRLGLKIPGPMVQIAIAWGMVEFKQKLRARKANQGAVQAIPGQLADAVTGIEAVQAAFTPKGIIPALRADVEVIK